MLTILWGVKVKSRHVVLFNVNYPFSIALKQQAFLTISFQIDYVTLWTQAYLTNI